MYRSPSQLHSMAETVKFLKLFLRCYVWYFHPLLTARYMENNTDARLLNFQLINGQRNNGEFALMEGCEICNNIDSLFLNHASLPSKAFNLDGFGKQKAGYHEYNVLSLLWIIFFVIKNITVKSFCLSPVGFNIAHLCGGLTILSMDICRGKLLDVSVH